MLLLADVPNKAVKTTRLLLTPAERQTLVGSLFDRCLEHHILI
jgi:hypothetical protein